AIVSASTDASGVATLVLPASIASDLYRITVDPPDAQRGEDLNGGNKGNEPAGPTLKIKAGSALYRDLAGEVEIVNGSGGPKLKLSRIPQTLGGARARGNFLHEGTSGLRLVVDHKPDFMRSPRVFSQRDPNSIVLHRTGGHAPV